MLWKSLQDGSKNLYRYCKLLSELSILYFQEDQDKPKPELGIAALTGVKPELKLSKKTAIQSIEAKLKMMENMKAGDDFVINKLAAHETPIIAQYQTKQHIHNKTITSFKRRHPYHRRR